MSCKIQTKTMNSLGKTITHQNQRNDVFLLGLF
ncbi:hypothetical protein FF38_11579 [Lucilia cuprina]|uniref:Uncharacterized protein n=1 Tax=Lucilia cuprina TaxID=7375 RepID=A0A0L0CBD2_LUCCU|nr:hypothetical protein FF38_11579 [Lucilia cuprina]